MKFKLTSTPILLCRDLFNWAYLGHFCAALVLLFTSSFLLQPSFALSPVFTGMVYTITDASLDNATVTIELDLTQYRSSSDGQGYKLVTRSKTFGLTEQVSNPRCGTTPLQQNKQGQWLAPASCKTVSWNVSLKRIQPGQVDAARQESFMLHGAKWFLLSEPTSLLHVVDAEVAYDSLVISSKLPHDEMPLMGASEYIGPHGKGWYAPLWRDAPEFYILGDVSSTQKQVGVFKVSYVVDDKKQADLLMLDAQHERVLHYLSDVFKNMETLSYRDRSLLVIRLGADNALSYTHGVAGKYSLVANYALGSLKDAHSNNLRSLLTMTHEQFHQLATIVRHSTPTQPTWVEESLAQYYALQTLKKLYPKNLEAMAVRNQYINEVTPIHEGLMRLQQKLDAGDNSVHPLFYTQGATFWAKLDQTLLRSSNNKTGLNEVLPELIMAYPNKDQKNGLPQAFTEKITEIGGASVEALLVQYVY